MSLTFPRAFRLFWVGVLLTVLLLLAFPGARAEEGDYDKIEQYIVTVDLREDGSADITYDIDWQVLNGSADEYLSWVKIGLANRHVDTLTPLSDTIQSVEYLEEDGSFAKVNLKQRYYAPDVAAVTGHDSRVRFAFSVHQSHLFTLFEDGSAEYSFSPGWFNELCVEEMVIRWKQEGEDFVTDAHDFEDGYYVWRFGPLEHGESCVVNVTVPALTGASFDPDLAIRTDDYLSNDDKMFAMLLMVVFVVVLLVIITLVIRAVKKPRWDGGFGEVVDSDAWDWYSNDIETIRVVHTMPPPVGFHPVDPPARFQAGGGHSRGGGAGRRSQSDSDSHHSSCACACVSSCACACACAGGGRAGCSVKNFYRIKLHSNKTEDPA